MIKHTAIALGLAMGAGTTFAAQGGADADASTSLGVNAAGVSAGVDAGSSLSQQFKALDSNGDGQLGRAEVEGHSMLESSFDSMDSTGDGSLSKAEFKAGLKASANDGVVGPAAEKGEATVKGARSEAKGAVDATTDTAVEAGAEAQSGVDAAADAPADTGSRAMDGARSAGERAGNTAESLGGSVTGATEAEAQGSIGADAEAGVE